MIAYLLFVLISPSYFAFLLLFIVGLLLILLCHHLLLILLSIDPTVPHLFIIIIGLIPISLINIGLRHLVPLFGHMRIPVRPGTVDVFLGPCRESLHILVDLIIVYLLVVYVLIVSGIPARKLVECLPIVQILKITEIGALTLVPGLWSPVGLSLSQVGAPLVTLGCFDREAALIKYKLFKSSLPALSLTILLPSQTIHIDFLDIIVCPYRTTLFLLLPSPLCLLFGLFRPLLWLNDTISKCIRNRFNL